LLDLRFPHRCWRKLKSFKTDAVEACKYLPVFRVSLDLSSTA